MDSITQAVLGAAIGEAMLGKKTGGKGAIIGAVIATIPDLDVIFYLIYDKLEMLSIHRGFSHSIVFSLLGALFIAALLYKTKWFRQVGLGRLLIFTWLCLFTHMLLDTFTAYGTQLLLPFSNQRMGLDSINVVDPVYTIPLIIGLVLSLRKSMTAPLRSIYNRWGLVISSVYLIFTLINKQNVESDISNILTKENIEYNSLLTMPVGIANINWYGVARGADSIYMIKHGIFSKTDSPITAFSINEHYFYEMDSKLADKMRWFAKGFYTLDKVDDTIRIYNLQVDMRGVIITDSIKAPTVGYFEVSNKGGHSQFSSGSISLQ